MFTFKKSDLVSALPASHVTYHCLCEFPAIMSLRTPAEFYNFKSFILELEKSDNLKSFDHLYFSLTTKEKYLFASFVRLSLSEFSCSRIRQLGHLMDNDFSDYFVLHYDFFDSFLGDLTFYQTLRVLALSFCFLVFLAMNPIVFHVEPIPEDATFDKYATSRFWLDFLPQLADFYKDPVECDLDSDLPF